LTATKLHENQLISERYKLFVEEDTGEIMYQINDQFNSSNNNGSLSRVGPSQANAINTSNTSRNYNLTKPVKEMTPIDMSIKHKPNEERIVHTKPIFLSQTSVCKELHKLHGNDTGSACCEVARNENVARANLCGSCDHIQTFPSLDEQMLNEYIEENMIGEAQKSSFDIQQDLETANFLANEDPLIPDVFEFDDNFLKRFESNLTEVNLGEDSRNGSVMTRKS
jgi:hypothetical protein